MNPFLFIWGLYTLGLGAAVVGTDKLELHRTMHGYTSSLLDRVLAVLTHLADGWVPTAVAVLILLLRDVRSFLMVGVSCAGSAIIVQILKRLFSMDRPAVYRNELGDMHWVPGVDLHHHFSFPSGHATAAFSLCFALALLAGRRFHGFLFAGIAVVLAYTRVYLSQHFTEDILVGAAIGTLTAWAVYQWLYCSPFAGRPWLRFRPIQLK